MNSRDDSRTEPDLVGSGPAGLALNPALPEWLTG